MALVHVPQEPVFQVCVAQVPRVVLPEYTVHLGGGQHLSDHVEHCVVVEGVPDLLELGQQPLKHPPLDGVGGHEVEDEAVEALTVAMNAPHALFQPVRVPGDVVVEEDVAALEVDALSGRLRGHQDLDPAVPELLLRVQPGTRLVTRTRPHAAVDASHSEPQAFRRSIR